MGVERRDGIVRALSEPRFAPYLTAACGDTDAALELYWWNVEVSSAFHPPLHCLEVGLRNALHEQLRSLFDRADWWAIAQLNGAGRRIVVDVVGKLGRRTRRTPAADDVVAELSFGFWVSLLSRGSGAAYDRRLWVPALHLAFPFYRGPRQRLHDRLYSVVLLRNRIMHHEPIHHRDLRADHDKILELIGYVAPAVLQPLKAIDRVGDVLGRRPIAGRPGRGDGRRG